MGKISLIASKYLVNAVIQIDGVVDRPDVIGAIFGQTEGLLGTDLELRELQRSGRIGRIEVNTDTRGGKTSGNILIPSSMDKAETAIIGASLEIIQRIGPCNARVRIKNIEDVRVSKRTYVIDRAKQLLAQMIDTVMPDSQEMADEVAHSVRMTEIKEYGKDRLPAGPSIDESDEIIVVEGRADVLALLKQGFKNVIAMNGTSCPQTIIDLSRKKEVTLFVDGDRGGNLIIKELLTVADVDFVTKAPDGKEVEELAKKELHKALRSKITAEQAKHELADTRTAIRKPRMISDRPKFQRRTPTPQYKPRNLLRATEKEKLTKMLEGLIGTKGAYLLDKELTILGKVPLTELPTTIRSMGSDIHAVVFDGSITSEIVTLAERSRIKHIIGMDSLVKESRQVNLVTVNNL
jgi:DNA primase